MTDIELIELKQRIQEVVEGNPISPTTAEMSEQVYSNGDVLTAGRLLKVRDVTWVAEVSIHAERTPIEIGDVGYRNSKTGPEAWRKPRGPTPAAVKRLGVELQEHIVRLRDSGRFATREQTFGMVGSFRALLMAVRSGDADAISEAVKHAEETLGQIDPAIAELGETTSAPSLR
jgi:hypothetical protein